MSYRRCMRLRAWFVFGGVVSGVCVACIGCPEDPLPLTHDSGLCVAYDFGLDEPEVGPDAGTDSTDSSPPDSDSDAVADAFADADAVADDTAETIADAADTDSDPDAPETLPGLGGKICRSDIEEITGPTAEGTNGACSLPSCHGRFPDGQGGLYIGPQGDWMKDYLVDVKSKERKDLVRVKPGDPKNSWMAHKLAGDQCLFGALCVDGDCGDQMPQTGQYIGDTDLAIILEWIRQGADTSADCSGGTK